MTGFVWTPRVALVSLWFSAPKTDAEKRFNGKLNVLRSAVERAFALLKGRSKRLTLIDLNSAAKIRSVIACGCVLHNFAVLQRDHLAESEIENDSPADQGEDGVVGQADLVYGVDLDGATKRDRIMQRFVN